MLRCGQMIFAQALVCRHLGRGESRRGDGSVLSKEDCWGEVTQSKSPAEQRPGFRVFLSGDPLGFVNLKQ